MKNEKKSLSILKKLSASLAVVFTMSCSLSACDISSFIPENPNMGGGNTNIEQPTPEDPNKGETGNGTTENPNNPNTPNEGNGGQEGGGQTPSDPDNPNEGSGGSQDNPNEGNGGNQDDQNENKPQKNTELSVHFLEFENKKSGDCTLIKTGDTEVLIDAGSTRGSADDVNKYLKKYCTDGVLEYVIATHAHEDHIAAFVGDDSHPGVFSQFETGIIIDYTGKKTTSQVSKDYESARDAEVQAGATHYTALECWKEQNGAKRTYELGENITLNILYQKYYGQSTTNENNYSVCVLLSENDNHYLFTGDLEEGGESSLVENNNLPKCKVYKGGHHGSKTSSTDTLLQKIQPEIVCVCSCAGDTNSFPHQEFIDRISVWTDQVYLTRMIWNGVSQSMNGNIVVTSLNGEVSVNCTNNNILLKDTEWFKANRTLPTKWRTA